MSNGKTTYEAMFLLDVGSGDFEASSEPIRVLLNRIEAEVLSLRPWDERRLAYEIKGRRRGLYALVYFRAQPDRIAELEHDSQLDERVLRLLVLRRDNLPEEELEADTPATAGARRAARREEAAAAKAAERAAAEKAEGEGGEAEEKPAAKSEAEGAAKSEAEGAGKSEAEGGEKGAGGTEAGTETAETSSKSESGGE